jgi:hypothetical protein
VVDDDGVGLTIRCTREERPGGRHGGHDPLHISGSLDLETVGTVVPDGISLEEFVEIGHELKEIHARMVTQQE